MEQRSLSIRDVCEIIETEYPYNYKPLLETLLYVARMIELPLDDKDGIHKLAKAVHAFPIILLRRAWELNDETCARHIAHVYATYIAAVFALPSVAAVLGREKVHQLCQSLLNGDVHPTDGITKQPTFNGRYVLIALFYVVLAYTLYTVYQTMTGKETLGIDDA
jgi:hypothetical protein